MANPLHRVTRIRFVSSDTFQLTVERKDFAFTAGQCVNIGLPGEAVNREYSTYSAEQDAKELQFLIRRVEGGAVSSALSKLKEGDLVEIHGAYGNFVLPRPLPRARFTFLATGTGIAPFHAFVKSHPELDYRILHGIRLNEERYDADGYLPGRYVACLSKERPSHPGDFAGRITDHLKAHPADPADIHFLCGNRAMINEAYDLLTAQGVSGDHVFTEVFF